MTAPTINTLSNALLNCSFFSLTMTLRDVYKRQLKSYHKIKKWEPKNIIISHGPCMIGQAKEMLNQEFFWLEK